MTLIQGADVGAHNCSLMEATMKILVMDFETTDKPQWKAPWSALRQARICQACGILFDEKATMINCLSSYVQPDRWKISDGAHVVNGLTNEQCSELGAWGGSVFNWIRNMMIVADIVVAHSIKFELEMLRIESERHQLAAIPSDREPEYYCTMMRTTDACKLPGKRGSSYKWPTLSEAHAAITGKIYDPKHDAMADTLACARIYFKMEHNLDLA